MRISDWSSDVCSSDLDQVLRDRRLDALEPAHQYRQFGLAARFVGAAQQVAVGVGDRHGQAACAGPVAVDVELAERGVAVEHLERGLLVQALLELPGRAALDGVAARFAREQAGAGERSAEHTSELQSLMRIS